MTTCAYRHCGEQFSPKTNRYGGSMGRPARFCSDLCRKAADRLRRQEERQEQERRERVARATEDHDRRLDAVAELVEHARTNPAGLVVDIVEWIERDTRREWAVVQMLLFVARRRPAPAGDER